MIMLELLHDAYYAEHVPENITHSSLVHMSIYLANGMVTAFETNAKKHFVEYVERFVNISWKEDHDGGLQSTGEQQANFCIKSPQIQNSLARNEKRTGLLIKLIAHAHFVVPQPTY